MKILCAAACTIWLACNPAGFGQTQTPCEQAVDAPLHARATLTIDSRPAGLEIVGTDKETLHVTCTTDDPERARHVKLRYSGGTDNEAGGPTLKITDPYEQHGNLQIRIEVPRKTNLRVQMGAGQVKVEDVAGDKAITLYAGQITISSDREWDYRRIDASVDIGQVNAAAYGVNKGGFFRSFTKKNDGGEYRLYAHILTGQIDLLGNDAGAGSE